MAGEDSFLRKLRQLVPPSDRVRVGPGDDAAVVAPSRLPAVVTTDLLVEGVDFLTGERPDVVGRRALAVNLSDLAAMGARPAYFLLGIGFRAELGEEYALAIAKGALSRATPLGVALAGGDLSDAPATFVSVALWGEAADGILLRRGAQVGDAVFVSGHPGRAAAGLRIARAEAEGSGAARASGPDAAELLAAYRDPEPRLELGETLAREGWATAAIDVSDGLGIDAGRLACASGVRVVLQADRIPIAPALARFARDAGLDPVELALSGGDDYEILFAAPPSAEAKIPETLGGTPLRRIGRVEPGAGAVLRSDSGDRDVTGAGHDHLRDRT